MTLPLENPTGAILRRLTRRSLQSEKRRNGMVVIAVALGAFLLCLAGTIGASLLQIRQDQITDTYEATYAGVTQADIAALKEVPEIARVGTHYVLSTENSPRGFQATYLYVDQDLLYTFRHQMSLAQGRLPQGDHEVALGAEDCDVAVVNTCGFLQEAREEALAEIDALAQAKAQGKLQKILVTGCMAQWWKDEIQARCPQADGFVGVSGYEDIAQVIAQALEDQHPAHFGDIDAPVPETDRVVCTSDYWAWLRIAEGCDNRCAYCIIPFIRGKFRSRPEEAILAEAQDLAQAGMQELIVVAQDITRYGLDLYGARTLAKLLPKLCAIEGIHWVRLHYLYPDEITDELIDVIANEPKIVKYLDIPIQHISDHLLKSMHRRGTGEEIRALFRKLRERIPGLVLRTSLIAGFPGETEEDFEELCTFLREFRIQRAGVFPFSPEEGSAAATYPDQVDEDVKRRRVELITELQLAVVDDWCESMMGQVVEVLCEGYDDETELYYGRSYADSPGIDGLVHFEGEEGGVRPGAFYQVKITSNYDGELIGILYEEDDEP